MYFFHPPAQVSTYPRKRSQILPWFSFFLSWMAYTLHCFLYCLLSGCHVLPVCLCCACLFSCLHLEIKGSQLLYCDCLCFRPHWLLSISCVSSLLWSVIWCSLPCCYCMIPCLHFSFPFYPSMCLSDLPPLNLHPPVVCLGRPSLASIFGFSCVPFAVSLLPLG